MTCMAIRRASLLRYMQPLVLQASGLSGLQDLRLALFLLLVSRIVKDRSALKSIGGPGIFVHMLEDGDARMRHTAASFLQVCEETQRSHPAPLSDPPMKTGPRNNQTALRMPCAGALRGGPEAGLLPGCAPPGAAGATEPGGSAAAQQIPADHGAAGVALCGPCKVTGGSEQPVSAYEQAVHVMRGSGRPGRLGGCTLLIHRKI